MTLSLIDDTKMTNIANAIRTKGGTSASLTPDEMVTAIANIPSGGTDYLEQRLKNTLVSYTIPDSVTSIPYFAFTLCTSLTSVTIPSSVTNIGYHSFRGCTGLTSITIPDSVTIIGEQAFSNCSGLTNIIIGNGVTSIGYGAFSRCTGLTGITIPNSVTSIGEEAFNSCAGLTSVTIGSGVTSIGRNAFTSYISPSNSKTITMLRSVPPTIYTDTFNILYLNKIIVPRGSLSAYQNADNWSNFASVMEEATE